MAESQDLPTEREEETSREVIQVRGRLTAQLIRALRRPCLAGHRSSKTLTSWSPSLRNEKSTSLFQ